MRGHLVPETSCGRNIDMWFMRSLLGSETEREEGVEAIESKTGSLYKVQSWSKSCPRFGPRFGPARWAGIRN
jgi:hypothetical protein